MIEIYTRKAEAQDEESHSLWGVIALALAVLALAVLASSPPAAAAEVKQKHADTKHTPAKLKHPEAKNADAKQDGNLKRAVFDKVSATPDVRQIADWVVDSGDNKDLPFAIIDKKNARIFVFEPNGHIKGAAPVLLGMAKGDHTVPGIGSKEYSDMRPQDRTTPAGRFSIERGPNEHGVNVVWLDYESALSLHPVVKGTPKERRAARLSSATAADNRISYGCINAPTAFFSKIIDPTFKQARGIIYVLPETQPLQQVFNTAAVKTIAASAPPATPVAVAPAATVAAAAPTVSAVAGAPASAAAAATAPAVATAQVPTAAAVQTPPAAAVPVSAIATTPAPAGETNAAGGSPPAVSVVKE
jgi:hypothetical protein